MSTADFDPAASKTSENHTHNRGINHLASLRSVQQVHQLRHDLVLTGTKRIKGLERTEPQGDHRRSGRALPGAYTCESSAIFVSFQAVP